MVEKKGKGIASHKLASGANEHMLASGLTKKKVNDMKKKLLKGAGLISGVAHTVGDIASFFGAGKKKKPAPKKTTTKKKTVKKGGASEDLFQ